MSSETLELTHGEETEEGRTNVGRDVWREQLLTGEGAVGEPGDYRIPFPKAGGEGFPRVLTPQ